MLCTGSARMWNICDRVLDGKDITSNSVVSWNSGWNNTLGTNKSVFSVINGFKNEDALARVRFRNIGAGARAAEIERLRKTEKNLGVN